MASDRAFRALAIEQPETVLALLRVITPRLVPENATVTPEDVDATYLEPPPAMDADWLARVGDDQTVHVEMQGYRDGRFPDRLGRYHLAALLRYPRRRVRTVAVWVVRPPEEHRLRAVAVSDVRVKVRSVVLAEVPAQRLLRDARTACFAAGADPGSWSIAELCGRVVDALRSGGASYREHVMAIALAATAGRYDAMFKAMKQADMEPLIIEDLVKFGEDQGALASTRRAVLRVLEARGLAVDAAQRARVQQEPSLDQLDAWLARAAVAGSTAEALCDEPTAGER